MAKKVVTFGELMLRLAPEGYYRFVQADTLGATFGGGEANVAVSLANYGLDAKFVSKLPTHEIGQAAVNSLRKYGVDTTFTIWKKVLPRDHPKLFMTVQVLPLQQLLNQILTGKRFLKVFRGSILPELLLH